MKKLLLCLIIFLAYKTHATTYTYTAGIPNYDWTHVASWSPSYPGTTINFGDTMHLEKGHRIDLWNSITVTINGVLIIDSPTANWYSTFFIAHDNSTLVVGATGKILCKNYIRLDNTSKMEIHGDVDVKNGIYETIYMQDSSEVLIHPSGQLFIEDSIWNGYNGTSTKIIVNGTMVNDGTIYNYGTINGTGSIITTNNQLNGNIVGGGYVAPGLSPGELKTDFDLALPASGKLNIEIGGITPGTTYDVLGGTGDKILAGTLNVQLYNGYTPMSGEEYTIITGGQISGTFTTINYPVLPNGLAWQISYNAANVKLKVVLVTGITSNNEKAITLYPNPVADMLYIYGLGNKLHTYKIYSILGEVLQSGEVSQEGIIKINFSNSPLNFIEIMNDEKEKIVKSFSRIN